MGAGCEERVDLQFFKWIWEYPKSKRPAILKRIDQFNKDKRIIILKTPNEVQRFIKEVQ